ncbi:DUF2971 domain-containing protein [Prevotella communis]|uniref:DUF2971 domain-containing protein n=1 Tax=Prevotella communis TaxID=2913614 RepID=UPI001EDA24EA|nr:DUF2971 domain-containing protein [Prevotella communis]UKK62372.1 DUF2971 domain-containing protein [Prevotella communis]
MLSFELKYDGKPDIEVWEEGFKKWLSAIEIDREKFKVKIVSGFDRLPNLGKMVATYDGKLLFDIHLYRKYGRSENGHRTICGMFTVSIQDEGKMLMKPGEKLQLNIDDKGRVNYMGKQTHIVEALMDVLPLRDEKVVKKIANALGVAPEHIKMDTYQKRYVIDTPIPELDWKADPMPSSFYKYVPLNVFHLMLLNGTFRMNSIISQSDTQESFYIGDFVCSDYEDEFKRFAGVISEQNTLISSFTTEYDSEYMWREYGDNGQGVCLCFNLIGGQTLKQMQYINEETTTLWKYKKVVDQLKKEGVHVHFSAIDDWHRFVKNDKYDDEKEWRLLIDYKGDIKYDLYGNRCVSYKDFKFKGRDLPEIGLQLESIVIGPNQPKGASNFPLLTQRAHKLFGDEVVVNRSQCVMRPFLLRAISIIGQMLSK